ncbi:hypothetical protein [Actinoplanes sp. NPDC049802]|uniref:hypothetical protein n=1 Tax=Actinoplanes sp. NPDC049802 TaxID=3154742 RepID=UPI0033F9F490
MSWSLHAVPVHALTEDGMAEWAARAEFRRGLPDRPPARRPLPTVEQVVTALREARCHGEAWFQVDGVDEPLPERPGFRYVGEVGLHFDDGRDRSAMSEPGRLVVGLSFRKPDCAGVLAAVRRLATIGGPQLVFDDSGDDVFVVYPDGDLAVLRAEWPW